MLGHQKSLVVAVAFVAFGAVANAQFAPPPPTNAAIENGNDQKAELGYEGEVANLDQHGYEESAEMAASEEAALRREISKLEGKVKSLQAGAERSKAKAELAGKRLELQKQKHIDIKKQVAQKEVMKRAEDKKLEQMQSQVKFAQERVQEISAKNAEARNAIQSVAKENRDLKHQLVRLQKQISSEQRKQHQLRMQKSRLGHQNKTLKSKLSVAEKKLGNRS